MALTGDGLLRAFDLDGQLLFEHRSANEDMSAPSIDTRGNIRAAMHTFNKRLDVIGFTHDGTPLPTTRIDSDLVVRFDLAPKLVTEVHACQDGAFLVSLLYRHRETFTAYYRDGASEPEWKAPGWVVGTSGEHVVYWERDAFVCRTRGEERWRIGSANLACAGASDAAFMFVDYSARAAEQEARELAALEQDLSDEELADLVSRPPSAPTLVRTLDVATGATQTAREIPGEVVSAYPQGDVIARRGSVYTLHTNGAAQVLGDGPPEDSVYISRGPAALGSGVVAEGDGERVPRVGHQLTKSNAVLHRGRIYERSGKDLLWRPAPRALER